MGAADRRHACARLGVHQGLAPVLDVARDLRWGRVEETIGEDPYLVGTIGSAYVAGVAVGGGRRHPQALRRLLRLARRVATSPRSSVGPRELADVLLPPFEMALRAGAGSVMNSYTDIDGVPVAADPPTAHRPAARRRYGFDGTVVADYFSVAFLQTLHGVAGTRADDAARLALHRGHRRRAARRSTCYGAAAARRGGGTARSRSSLVDRAAAPGAAAEVRRSGLLDAGWSAGRRRCSPNRPPRRDRWTRPAEHRALARRLAERSVVLLRNDGALPLAPRPPPRRRRTARRRARRDDGLLLLPAARRRPPPRRPARDRRRHGARGARSGRRLRRGPRPQAARSPAATTRRSPRRPAWPRSADVCVAVLGDLAGLFGRGTSGEGCDAADLRLPGRQEELLEALLATGHPGGRWCCSSAGPTTSRARSTGWPPWCAGSSRARRARARWPTCSAGRVNPSGRLPVSFPGDGAGQPSTYLAAPAREAQRRQQRRPHAAVPVRSRAVLPPGRRWDGVDGDPSATLVDRRRACRVTVTLSNDGGRRRPPRSSRSTCTTPSRRSRAPSSVLLAAPRVDLAAR